MKFSYNWLQELIKEQLPKPKDLADFLSLHSFEVEGLEKIGKDFVFDIDVTANRVSDCSCHVGMAREIAAFLDFKFKAGSWEVKENNDLKVEDLVEINVKARKMCQRYLVRAIKGVRVGPSPAWLKQKLEVCGLQSINNIVDIANYVMLETGQPLHIFDLDKLADKKIIIRTAKQGEEIVTLDNQKFVLDEDILVIADGKNPVAVAGIKGGKGPGVSEKTKDIILEAANFDAISIRGASQKLKLRTDASLRFEHGIDLNLTEEAIDRVAGLVQELAGGEIARGVIDFFPQETRAKMVKLDLKKVDALLGLKIPKKDCLRILKALNFKVVKDLGDKIEVIVPTKRLDISIPEDLIEEIGRIYGYEKILAIPPKACLIPPKRNLAVFWTEFSRDNLKEAGLTEVYNYSFIGQELADIFRYEQKELVEIENPLSENQKYLAPSLLPNLLINVLTNFRYLDEVRIFEIGKIFKRKKAKVLEERNLTGLIASKAERQGFYEFKGMLDNLLESMAIAGAWYDEYQATPEQSNISIWNINRAAEIKIDGEEIGFLGEVSPKILTQLKIKGKVVAFDIDFEKLQALASEEHEYQLISPYPSAIRDLALLVPLRAKVVDVLNIINRAGGKLVRDVDLFDIYEGEGLPQGRKNFAFHIIYQAEDKTLKAEEIDKIHQKIINALEENGEWEVRK